jgi:hypothetical protein
MAADHAATVEIWVAMASISGGVIPDVSSADSDVMYGGAVV